MLKNVQSLKIKFNNELLLKLIFFRLLINETLLSSKDNPKLAFFLKYFNTKVPYLNCYHFFKLKIAMQKCAIPIKTCSK